MCNGFSTLASQGGSIATLQPIGASPIHESFHHHEQWQLLFSNEDEDGSSVVGTHVELRGLQRPLHRRYWVAIQYVYLFVD